MSGFREFIFLLIWAQTIPCCTTEGCTNHLATNPNNVDFSSLDISNNFQSASWGSSFKIAVTSASCLKLFCSENDFLKSASVSRKLMLNLETYQWDDRISNGVWETSHVLASHLFFKRTHHLDYRVYWVWVKHLEHYPKKIC